MQVWQPALSKHLAIQNWTSVAVASLFLPNPPKHQPLVDLSAVLLLSAILASIWKYHWKTIMDNEAFDADTILRAIDAEVVYLLAQEEEKKRLQTKAEARAPTTPPEPP